jgi:multiple sugar transport system ATP-binding protein
MGDRVAVMRKGELQQVADPQTLYDQPVNLFVGGFIGSPSMNMLEATLERSNGSLAAVAASQRIHLDDETLGARPDLKTYEGKRVILGIRPEDIEDAAIAGGADGGRIGAVVDIREDLGSEVLIHFGIGAAPVRGEDVAAAVGKEALEATAVQAREKGNVFVARIDRETRAAERERIELAVYTKRLHFFDPETSRGIYGADNEAG